MGVASSKGIAVIQPSRDKNANKSFHVMSRELGKGS